MIAPQPHRRRRRDAPLVTIHHGANADCPDVLAGRWTRCYGHTSTPTAVLVPEEGAVEHCRNALQLVRCSIEHDEPMLGNGTPGVVVPITTLARIQARLEAAISLLVLDGGSVCLTCRGSVLPATIGGVPRGTCHCPRNLDAARFTDWDGCTIAPRTD